METIQEIKDIYSLDETLTEEQLNENISKIIRQLDNLNNLYTPSFLKEIDGEKWHQIVNIYSAQFQNWYSEVIQLGIKLKNQEVLNYFESNQTTRYTVINLNNLYTNMLNSMIKNQEIDIKTIEYLAENNLLNSIEVFFNEKDINHLDQKIKLISNYEEKVIKNFSAYWKSAIINNLEAPIDWLLEFSKNNNINSEKILGIQNYIYRPNRDNETNKQFYFDNYNEETLKKVLSHVKFTRYSEEEYKKIYPVESRKLFNYYDDSRYLNFFGKIKTNDSSQKKKIEILENILLTHASNNLKEDIDYIKILDVNATQFLIENNLIKDLSPKLFFEEKHFTSFEQKIKLIPNYEEDIKNHFREYWKMAIVNDLDIPMNWLFDFYQNHLKYKDIIFQLFASDMMHLQSKKGNSDGITYLDDYNESTFKKVLSKFEITQYYKEEYLKLYEITDESNLPPILYSNDLEALSKKFQSIKYKLDIDKDILENMKNIFKEIVDVHIEKENILHPRDTYENNGFYQTITEKINLNRKTLNNFLSELDEKIINALSEEEITKMDVLNTFISDSYALMNKIKENYSVVNFKTSPELIIFNKNHQLISLLVERFNIDFKIAELKNIKEDFKLPFLNVIQEVEMANTQLNQIHHIIDQEVNKNSLKQNIKNLREINDNNLNKTTEKVTKKI
jgi:hypothetical protein